MGESFGKLAETDQVASATAQFESLPPLEFRPLDDDCRREGFLCGHGELDSWFRKHSLKTHNKFKSRVTTAHFHSNSAPVGFYSLRIAIEDEVLLESGVRALFRPEKRVFASVQLEYLGVLKSLRRRGIGRLMLAHALNQFHDVVVTTGIAAMTLVAADENATIFYEKLGFGPYGPPSERRMLIPAQTVIEMVQRVPVPS